MSERFTKSPSSPPTTQDYRIFAFTGLPGVGKSAVAKEMADIEGVPIVNMGDEMRAQYKTLPEGDDCAETPDGTWEMAQALRDAHGTIGPAIASLSRIAACFVESNVVIVDGVRNPDTVEYLEEIFGCPVHLIAVTADDETRLNRFYDRGDYDEKEYLGKTERRVVAECNMEKRTVREAEEGLRDAISYANYHIDNNGSLGDAQVQCARLLDDFDPLL